MKRYFLLGLAIVLVIVIGIISYGAYLNRAGENVIAERMAERRIPLQGAKAEIRNIKTRVVLDTVNLYSNEMTDTIALIDGRITSVNVKKNDFVQTGQILFDLTNEQYPLKIKQAEIDILRAESDILKADNDIVKAETYLARAKNDYLRYSRLREHQAVSAEKWVKKNDAFSSLLNTSNITLKTVLTIFLGSKVLVRRLNLLSLNILALSKNFTQYVCSTYFSTLTI